MSVLSSYSNISKWQNNGDLIDISITVEFPSYVKKIQSQILARNLDFVTNIEAVPDESKLFCTIPLDKLWVIATLNFVRRIFLNLYTMPITDDSPILGDSSKYYDFLHKFHSQINLNRVTDIWQKIYHRKPHKWTVIVNRVGGKTTKLYQSCNINALSTALRESLDSFYSDKTYREDRNILEPSRKQGSDFQIFFRVVPRRITAGIPILTRRMMKKYVYMHKGLHHSACWGLAKIAQMKVGEVVGDLMCGKSALLLEAEEFNRGVFFLGSDIDRETIDMGKENVEKLKVDDGRTGVDLLLQDGTNSVYSDGCLDCVLCDLPFGVQMGSTESNRELYPSFMKELNRSLRRGGRSVLLTSEACGLILLDAVEAFSQLRVLGVSPMRLGSIDCLIFLIVKKSSGDHVISRGLVKQQALEEGSSFAADAQGLKDFFQVEDLPTLLSASELRDMFALPVLSHSSAQEEDNNEENEGEKEEEEEEEEVLSRKCRVECRRNRFGFKQVNFKDLKPTLVLFGNND